MCDGSVSDAVVITIIVCLTLIFMSILGGKYKR